MKARITAIGCCLLFALPGISRADEKSEKANWIQLFNGKDLKDWQIKITGYDLGDNFGNTFRVEDGLLKVAYDKYENFDGRFGHIFYKKPFRNYRLRVEYRFVGNQVPGGPGWAFRNSGLMLHGQTAASMARDQKFPASIEVQILGGKGVGTRTTSNLCTPGTNVVMAGKLRTAHCTNSRSQTYHGDQWVTAEVEVLGNRIRHILEGEVVLEYSDPQLDERDADAKKLLAAGMPKMLRGGTISLQSESHPVHFRKVELLELEDPEAGKGWRDLLAGVDSSKNWHLKNWTTRGNWKLGKDGVVTLTPRPGESGWSRFDDYLWLVGKYENFEFEFDYKVQKGGNSGFYFHVGDRKSPVAHGVEVQIYESYRDGKKRERLTDHDSGGIIPGLPPTKNAARPAGEWNHFHIACKGNDVTVKLNGVVVNRVKLDSDQLKSRPKSGFIGFQDHALPLALRKIRIRRTDHN